MLYRITLVVFSALILTTSVSAQQLAWTRSIGAPDDKERLHAVCAAGNGMMVAGYVENDSTREVAGFVTKVGPTGAVEWMRAPAGGSLAIVSVVPADQDTYTLVACPSSPARHRESEFDFMLIRIDSSGTVLWKRTFSTPDRIYVDRALRARNGDLLVAGITTFPVQSPTLRALRIDSNGQTIWSTAVDEIIAFIHHVEELPDGDIAIAGYASETGVIVLSPSGDSVFAMKTSHSLQEGEEFDPLGIHPGSDETMLVFGTIQRAAKPPSTMPWFQVSMEKFDAQGNHLEHRPGPPDAAINCTRTLSDGTILAAGPLGSGDTSWLRLMRFDQDGNILANVAFPRRTQSTMLCLAIQELNNGMAIVAGIENRAGGGTDIFLAGFTNIMAAPASAGK